MKKILFKALAIVAVAALVLTMATPAFAGDKTPPGQDPDRTPPGQQDKDHNPPGQIPDRVPPGQENQESAPATTPSPEPQENQPIEIPDWVDPALVEDWNTRWPGWEQWLFAQGNTVKITWCHVPPGNPGAAHTIQINLHGAGAGHNPHQAHSLDYPGPCEEEPPVEVCQGEMTAIPTEWTWEQSRCIEGWQFVTGSRKITYYDARTGDFCYSEPEEISEVTRCGDNGEEECGLQGKVKNPGHHVVEIYTALDPKDKTQPGGVMDGHSWESWVIFGIDPGQTLYFFDHFPDRGWSLRARLTAPNICSMSGRLELDWGNLENSIVPLGLELEIFQNTPLQPSPIPAYLYAMPV